jgi:cyclophilin family peptidyl-prolyl cis-trans isomerase
MSARFSQMCRLSCVALLFLAGCSSAPAKSSGGLHATIETDRGGIELEFFPADAPKGVENFRLLAERKYYDGLTFHRIVKGFMLQGGDPKGNGTGGESAWGGEFADEINPGSPLYQAGYKRGIVAYANRGPNTNGSQFFIMHGDYPLDPNYVIFAKVVGGFEVVEAIANTPTTMGDDGNMSRPLTPVIIKKVTIKP